VPRTRRSTAGPNSGVPREATSSSSNWSDTCAAGTAHPKTSGCHNEDRQDWLPMARGPLAAGIGNDRGAVYARGAAPGDILFRSCRIRVRTGASRWVPLLLNAWASTVHDQQSTGSRPRPAWRTRSVLRLFNQWWKRWWVVDCGRPPSWTGGSNRPQPARFLLPGLAAWMPAARARLTPEPGQYSLFLSGSVVGNTRSPLLWSTTITVRSP
jgi:hypothetical protein